MIYKDNSTTILDSNFFLCLDLDLYSDKLHIELLTRKNNVERITQCNNF